jgi:hypothetical protein
MDQTWWLTLLGAILLAWGASLIFVRYWTKKRLLRSLAQKGIKTEEVEIQIDDPRPEDQQALEIIRAYRRRFLLKLWPDTRFNLQALSDISQTLVKEIAANYFPDEERPELRASLADLVALFNRVGARLAVWLETLPVRPLKDVELQTLFQYHEWYQKVKQHPGYLFLKRHHLDRLASWAWTAKNVLNPWYWGRRAAYTGSRELLQRLILAKVTTLVGEEAIYLYSRRRPNERLFKRCELALQEMVNLSLDDGLPGSQASNYMLRFILRSRGLEDQEKLALLQRLAQPRRQEIPGIEQLNTKERQDICRWLEQLVKTCWTGSAQEQRLAQVRSRWED